MAQLLRQTVVQQAPGGTRVREVDVVASPQADPRGAALNASVLPVALAWWAALGLGAVPLGGAGRFPRVGSAPRSTARSAATSA